MGVEIFLFLLWCVGVVFVVYVNLKILSILFGADRALRKYNRRRDDEVCEDEYRGPPPPRVIHYRDLEQ